MNINRTLSFMLIFLTIWISSCSTPPHQISPKNIEQWLTHSKKTMRRMKGHRMQVKLDIMEDVRKKKFYAYQILLTNHPHIAKMKLYSIDNNRHIIPSLPTYVANNHLYYHSPKKQWTKTKIQEGDSLFIALDNPADILEKFHTILQVSNPQSIHAMKNNKTLYFSLNASNIEMNSALQKKALQMFISPYMKATNNIDTRQIKITQFKGSMIIDLHSYQLKQANWQISFKAPTQTAPVRYSIRSTYYVDGEYTGKINLPADISESFQ